jgi:hypothetical protein
VEELRILKKFLAVSLALLLAYALGGVAFAVPVGPQQGTYTIGYWKTHAGLGPQQDMVSPLLPIWLGTPGGEDTVVVRTNTAAVKYLKMTGGASNGIVKLYAQLLGAKLNGNNGADLYAVWSVVEAADRFLATHGADDWKSLSKAEQSQVLSWMNTLDKYNNGVIGPGHAD